MGVSHSEYARRRGISRQAVSKAVKAGRIPTEPDGTIDPAKADAAMAAGMNPARDPMQRGDRKTSGARPRAPGRSGDRKVSGRARGNGRAAEAGQGMSFSEARTAKMVMDAQIARLNYEKLKGELVDRERVVAVVFRLAREERDAWLNWPARVSAILAAELGVDPHTLHTLLEKHVREQLESLSEINPKL